MPRSPRQQAYSSAHIGVDYNSKEVSLGVVRERKVLSNLRIFLGEDVLASFIRLRETLNLLQSNYETSLNVYIEKPWMRSKAGTRGDTGLFTARTAAFIEIAVLQAGMNPVFVYPQSWRKTIYGATPRGSDTKELAITYVEEELGYNLPVLGKTGRGHKPDHNIAEAILIALAGNIYEEKETI